MSTELDFHLDGFEAADDLTARVEQKLRTSGDRYKVLDSYTSDYDPCETWTLTRDSIAEQAPIRVFLEEADFDARTYTMREGAFADEDAARHWLTDRSTALPQPPDCRGDAAVRRTSAALTRSAGASAMPNAGRDSHSTSLAGTAQHPSPGRSM